MFNLLCFRFQNKILTSVKIILLLLLVFGICANHLYALRQEMCACARLFLFYETEKSQILRIAQLRPTPTILIFTPHRGRTCALRFALYAQLL